MINADIQKEPVDSNGKLFPSTGEGNVIAQLLSC